MPTAQRELATYGPIQMPDRLGLSQAQLARAVRMGLIPPADDATGRWPAAVFQATLARVEEIRAQVGELPDLGAVRAADVLQERLGVPVTPDAVIELGRARQLPVVGEHKGHLLYDGRALELFSDRAALERAKRDGRLLVREEVAEELRIRLSDADHLVRSGRLRPAAYTRSRWRAEIPLYRAGDVAALERAEDIDWEAVRTTPKGRRSPLAALPSATEDARGRG